MRTLRLLALSSTVLLAACGGGGGDSGTTACSSLKVLNISTQWNTGGTLGTTIEGKVGQPLTSTPVITGVPDSCVADEHFSSVAGTLPAGLSLNAQTGEVSGTPTQALSTGATGMVQLELPGYNAVPILNIVTITN